MPERFALFIGNDQYEDQSLARLKTPSADVQGLARAFEDPSIGHFDEVSQLINEADVHVRRAVGKFFSRRRADDLLLLYFSGHGVLDDQGRLYLAVKDTCREYLNSTAISAAFITSEMDSCRSKRQILILDCCHSGAFVRGAKGHATVDEATFKGNGYGRVVLTASNSTQYALEGDQIIQQAELSLFSHYLLQGLVTGDADAEGRGFVSLDDWYEYVYGKILGQTELQTPQKWTYSQQGEIIIAKSNRKTHTIEDLPLELRKGIESPYANFRAAAVEELGRLMKGSDKGLAAAALLALKNMADDDSRQVHTLVSQLLTTKAEPVPEVPKEVPAKAEPAPEAPMERTEVKEPVAPPSAAGTAPKRVEPKKRAAETTEANPAALSLLPKERREKTAEIVRLIEKNRKIDAIKLYRETFGVGLYEAKQAVENMSSSQPARRVAKDHRSAMVEIAGLIEDGKRVEAITLYREAFDVGLNKAKEAVDEMALEKSVAKKRTRRKSSHKVQSTLLLPPSGRVLEGHGSKVVCAEFSPDGRMVASGAGGSILIAIDSSIRLWRADDGGLIHKLDGLGYTATCVAFSPNCKLVAAGSNEKKIRVWNVADGKLLRHLEGHTSQVTGLCFSPDGKILASSSHDGSVRLWQDCDSKSVRILSGTQVLCDVQFSPDGQMLASAGYEKKIRLWRVSDGTLLKTLEGHTEWISSLSFSPDGSLLASSTLTLISDPQVRIWRVSDGKMLKAVSHTSTGTSKVKFAPDGRIIAFTAGDKAIRLYSVPEGKLLGTIDGHTACVNGISFSPDGVTLASASDDKTVRLWKLR